MRSISNSSASSANSSQNEASPCLSCCLVTLFFWLVWVQVCFLHVDILALLNNMPRMPKYCIFHIAPSGLDQRPDHETRSVVGVANLKLEALPDTSDWSMSCQGSHRSASQMGTADRLLALFFIGRTSP